MQQKLITAATVCDRLGGVSRMTLWRWLRDPTIDLPTPVYIKHRRYWLEHEIEAYARRAMASRTEVAA